MYINVALLGCLHYTGQHHIFSVKFNGNQTCRQNGEFYKMMDAGVRENRSRRKQ